MCYLLATLKNFPSKAATIQLQVLGLRDVSDISPTSSNFGDCFDSSSVVACVGLEKFAEFCKIKSSEAYLVL